MAQAGSARFMRFNPTHPTSDYGFYMRGLTDIAYGGAALQGFFGFVRSDRYPTHSRDAFRDFSQLLRSDPNSQYAENAQKRLAYLKERLAKYELSVAQFYTKRGAYVAVVNRVEGMMKDYPDTEATHQALPFMENAYRQLQLTAEADKVAKIIAANSQS